jgi:hypothetical protein
MRVWTVGFLILLWSPPALAQTDSSRAACRAMRGLQDSVLQVDAEPRPLRVRGLEGKVPADASAQPVTVRFVVRADGTVDPATLRVGGTTDAKWIRHVRRALGGSRFVPARHAGCPIGRWTTLTYTFARP